MINSDSASLPWTSLESYETSRSAPRVTFFEKMVARIAMSLVNPVSHQNYDSVNNDFEKQADELKNSKHIVHKITADNKHTHCLIAPFGAENNKRWIIYALGRHTHYENHMIEHVEMSAKFNANTLLTNPPAVQENRGNSTRAGIGHAFLSAIELLEHMGAKEIILYGVSLGAGMLSEAIMQHDFKQNECKYLVISDRTFDKLSNVAGKISKVGLLPSVMRGLDIELDNVSASEKLSGLEIPQIIIQHTDCESDGLINTENTLKAHVEHLEHKLIIGDSKIHHWGPHSPDIVNRIAAGVKQYFP